MQTFGERLKNFRTARGLDQRQLGELIHLSHTAVSRIERGERAVKIDEALAIAEALGVPLMSLLGEESLPSAASF